MSHHPIPLGTAFDNKTASWTVIHIGTGRVAAAPLQDDTSSVHLRWSHYQAAQELLAMRGREVEAISAQTRKRLVTS